MRQVRAAIGDRPTPWSCSRCRTRCGCCRRRRTGTPTSSTARTSPPDPWRACSGRPASRSGPLRAYDDQYLMIEARPSAVPARGEPLPIEDDIDDWPAARPLRRDLTRSPIAGASGWLAARRRRPRGRLGGRARRECVPGRPRPGCCFGRRRRGHQPVQARALVPWLGHEIVRRSTLSTSTRRW